MLNLFKMDFLTPEYDIFFRFWYLNVENETKRNQVIYFFIDSSRDIQYCFIITKSGWGKMTPKIKKTGTLFVKGFLDELRGKFSQPY